VQDKSSFADHATAETCTVQLNALKPKGNDRAENPGNVIRIALRAGCITLRGSGHIDNEELSAKRK
jgi:hypothetical protein